MLFKTVSTYALVWMILAIVPHGVYPQSELEREAKKQLSLVGANEPGMLLSVTKKDKILLKEAKGFANLKCQIKFDSQTPMRIASLTKQFVVVAAIRLVEDGVLTLDAPVHRYLPRMKKLGDQITIRHLLNHTSGLPHHSLLFMNAERVPFDMDAPGGFLFAPLGSRSKDFMPTNKEVLDILVEFPKLRSKTGEKWEYNNSAYVVLTLVVEKITGLRFETYLQRKVLSPLDMRNTGLARPLEVRRNTLAKSYEKQGNKFVEKDYSPFNNIFGDGGLYSTLDDMTDWRKAWQTTSILKRESIEQILAPAKLNNGKPASDVPRGKGYGMGWFIDELDGKKYYYHGGGWANFRHAVLWSPSHEVWIVVLTNRYDSKPYEQAKNLFAALLKDEAKD